MQNIMRRAIRSAKNAHQLGRLLGKKRLSIKEDVSRKKAGRKWTRFKCMYYVLVAWESRPITEDFPISCHGIPLVRSCLWSNWRTESPPTRLRRKRVGSRKKDTVIFSNRPEGVKYTTCIVRPGPTWHCNVAELLLLVILTIVLHCTPWSWGFLNSNGWIELKPAGSILKGKVKLNYHWR